MAPAEAPGQRARLGLAAPGRLTFAAEHVFRRPRQALRATNTRSGAGTPVGQVIARAGSVGPPGSGLTRWRYRPAGAPPLDLHVDKLHQAPDIERNTVSPAADDPHLLLVEEILRGLPTFEERLAWIEEWMPITSRWLGIKRSWSQASASPGDGSGAMTRGRVA